MKPSETAYEQAIDLIDARRHSWYSKASRTSDASGGFHISLVLQWYLLRMWNWGGCQEGPVTPSEKGIYVEPKQAYHEASQLVLQSVAHILLLGGFHLPSITSSVAPHIPSKAPWARPITPNRVSQTSVPTLDDLTARGAKRLQA